MIAKKKKPTPRRKTTRNASGDYKTTAPRTRKKPAAKKKTASPRTGTARTKKNPCQKGRGKRYRSQARENPGLAEKFYKAIHWGIPSKNSRSANIVVPDTLAVMGKVSQIRYLADKGNQKDVEWIHDFEPPYPTLAVDPESRQIFIVGGKYTVTARGIEG